MDTNKSIEHLLLKENERLRKRLLEAERAEDILRAIKYGEVDALVINGPLGDRFFTLKSEEHPYRVFVESINEGAATIDESGLVVYCNDTFSRLLDLPNSKILGKPFLNFVEQSAAQSEISEYFHSPPDGTKKKEVALLGKNRIPIPVRLSVAKILTEGLNSTCMIVTDLREQKRNEILGNQQKWLEEILNKMHTPLIMVEPQTGQVVFSNQRADEMTGGDFATLLSQTDSPAASWARGEMLRNLEMSWNAPDGRKDLIINSDLIPEMYGHPSVVLIAFQDITKLKEIERALEKTNQELDRFAAVAAHDLKSPAHSISQFAEILAKDYQNRLNPQSIQYLGFIVKAAKRMTQLVDSLLSYARVGHGDEKDNKDVNMTSLLNTIKTNLSAEIKDSKVHIRSAGLASVYGNEIELCQVFQNLIANAIKFRRPHIAAEIEVEQKDLGECWQFSVTDNGLGIPADQLHKIFEPFRRAHIGPAGSGIGLATVKKIIENHGGKIWVESNEQQGSKFFFTFPKSQTGPVSSQFN